MPNEIRAKVFNLLSRYGSMSRSALKKELSFYFLGTSHCVLMDTVDVMIEKEEIFYRRDDYSGECFYYMQ